MTDYAERGAEVEEKAGEDKQEKRARELIELLQELRVVLPGVQVLFAFLLTVPFAQRFSDLNGIQRGVFFATLLFTAAATALFIAPSAHHRLLWRQGASEERLRVGNRLTILGLLLLVPAMIGVVFVISTMMFNSPIAGIVTVAMALSFVLLWFALPLWLRQRNSG